MVEIRLFSKICSFIVKQSELHRERKRLEYLKKFNIDGKKITKNVEIFNICNVQFGIGTFMNSGQVHAGINSKIQIGEYCSIGYNVHIKSFTHDSLIPTGPNAKMIEKDIIIGNYVWIGDNVFIREGVSIGNNVIIGANSIVTKDVESNSIVGGCPAKSLRYI